MPTLFSCVPRLLLVFQQLQQYFSAVRFFFLDIKGGVPGNSPPLDTALTLVQEKSSEEISFPFVGRSLDGERRSRPEVRGADIHPWGGVDVAAEQEDSCLGNVGTDSLRVECSQAVWIFMFRNMSRDMSPSICRGVGRVPHRGVSSSLHHF